MTPEPTPLQGLLDEAAAGYWQAAAYHRACEMMRQGVSDIALVESSHRMACLEAQIRDAVQAQRERDAALLMAGAPGMRAPEPAPATPVPRRRARQDGFWPRVIQGAVPVAAFAAVRHGAAHGIRVKALAATGTAAAASVTVLALGANYAPAPYQTHAAQHAPAAVSHLAPADAVPYTPPPSYEPRHSAGTETTSAKRARGRHRAPGVTVAPLPSPSPVPPSPAPPAVAEGTLVIQEQHLTLGPGGTAVLDLIAEGGPVTWSAGQVPAGIVLSVDAVPVTGGVVAGGGAVQVQVSADPALLVQPGSAVLVLDGQQVTVTWGGRP